MNIAHPLKYHFYSYRKPYLIYLVLYFVFLFTSISSFKYIEKYSMYLSAILLIITIVFTIINSIYEFTLLIYHYLNLKIIKLEFFISSIIYSIINAFIQIFLMFISGLVIKSLLGSEVFILFGFENLQIYLFTFLLHTGIFSIIGIISLLLRNIKFVQILLYSIILIIVGIISFEIMNIVVEFIYKVFLDSNFIFKLNPLIIIITVLMWLLIYLKINKSNQ